MLQAYVAPIKASRRKDATSSAVSKGEKRAGEISKILSTFFLQRKKEDVLKHVLKTKSER